MMTKTLKILCEARALLSDSDRWARKTFARDANHQPVSPNSKTATCWCAVGVVARLTPSGSVARHEALRTLAIVARRELAARGWEVRRDEEAGTVIGRFNDDEQTVHFHVVKLFNDAIADLEELRETRNARSSV